MKGRITTCGQCENTGGQRGRFLSKKTTFIFKSLKTALAHTSDSSLFIPLRITSRLHGSHLHFLVDLISKYFLPKPASRFVGVFFSPPSCLGFINSGIVWVEVGERVAEDEGSTKGAQKASPRIQLLCQVHLTGSSSAHSKESSCRWRQEKTRRSTHQQEKHARNGQMDADL